MTLKVVPFKFRNQDLETLLSLNVKGYTSKPSKIKRALEQIPQISDILDLSYQEVVNSVLKNSFILEYDFHSRFERIVLVYGEENRDRIKTIFRGKSKSDGRRGKGDFRFLTYSHENTLNRKVKLAKRLLDLNKDVVVDAIMDHPKIISYSMKRDIESIRTLLQLSSEGFELVPQICLTYHPRSPYQRSDISTEAKSKSYYDELRRKLPLKSSQIAAE